MLIKNTRIYMLQQVLIIIRRYLCSIEMAQVLQIVKVHCFHVFSDLEADPEQLPPCLQGCC